jgi:predicted DCC family thiol-disulfide oxidoreductase YuxK
MNSDAIILFDGVCNLCNASVQFVIQKDKANYFKFASLQSAFGQKVLAENNLSGENFDSFLLLEKGQLHQHSTAAFKVARKLVFPWNLMHAFIIVPPFIRNFVYNFIAKNRYKWFGKKDECMLPAPHLKEKFLD